MTADYEDYDYPRPSGWLRPLFVAAERHGGVFRLTVPLWWARYQYLCWRGVIRPDGGGPHA